MNAHVSGAVSELNLAELKGLGSTAVHHNRPPSPSPPPRLTPGSLWQGELAGNERETVSLNGSAMLRHNTARANRQPRAATSLGSLKGIFINH